MTCGRCAATWQSTRYITAWILIAFQLVIMAGVPMGFASFLVVSGNLIERWTMYHVGHELTPYILGLWAAVRWIIAVLTSIAVISLVIIMESPEPSRGIVCYRER